ncbi:arrestin domain-containing protein 3-like [Arapaima gigas]
MSNTVNSISISYDAINEQNNFSNGDILTGRVVVVVSKKTKIEVLLVKARGKAEVFWTEQHGDQTHHYHAKEKYLQMDQVILSRKKDTGDIVLAPGSHVYPFAFEIPHGNMPSTFKGAHGSIEYKLEAKLSRSWRMPMRAKSPFTFQSKVNLTPEQLMSPQHGTITKKFKVFTSGDITLNVTLDKSGFHQGEGIMVKVEVDNNTSRDIAPKFCVTQKQSFFAGRNRKLHMNKVLKTVGDPIRSKSQQMLVEVLTLPPNLSVSILNCGILRVEYKLRVYLDVPYAKDPELKLPFVILPIHYNLLPTANPGPSVPLEAFGNTSSIEYETNPPSNPSGNAYPAAPAMFPPQPFLLQNSVLVPPPYAETTIPPPQTGPLAPPPYSALSPFSPLFAPGAPPPYTALGHFPTQSAPMAPPPYRATGKTESQPGPDACPAQGASALYPSLKSGQNKPL